MRYILGHNVLASRQRIIVTALLCLGLLGYVDWITGPSVAVTCFYLIPLCLLSWFSGTRVGYFVAAIHALIWFAIDLETLPLHSPIMYSNALVRFITFAVVVRLVHLCKNLTGEIELLVQDKTAVLQREIKTRAAAEEAIRQLASQLSAAEEAERRRLGQEIHESFGQSLILLKLRLESLAAAMPAMDDQSTDITGSLAILSSMIQQARTLTFDLYPPMLDELGLTVTLRHYAQKLAGQVNADVRIADAGPELELPSPLVCFLYRAVKELITNSLKHGSAKEILVHFRRRAGSLRILVSDDGTGFGRPPTPSTGLGLPWMRERLRGWGGSLEIESTTSQGARVILDVPTATAPPHEMEKLPLGQLTAS